MNLSLFDYHLPNELIAQEPAAVRDASRLMVVDRKTRSVTHAQFSEIGQYLPTRPRFFRNNAAVLKGAHIRATLHWRQGRVPTTPTC